MDLLIVRHAIAFGRDPLQWPDDTLRPLTPEGEAKMAREAKGLAKVVSKVDLVLSSPWTRAWQTAVILHQAASWPEPKACEALEGHRNPKGLLNVLKEQAGLEVVAIVGHEPQTQGLASFLLTGDGARVMIEFKKAGVVRLSLGKTIRAGTATLIWSLPPRVLRAIG